MSTLLETPPETEKPNPAQLLEDRFPEALKLPRVFAGFTALLGVVFFFYSYQSLYHTDLWGHLAYGRAILAEKAIPTSEPFMPLARGVPLVDTAWLTQVLGAAAEAKWGLSALQFLHAVIVTTCSALLVWNFYRRTGSVTMCVLGLAVFGMLNWFQFEIVRPQMAGLLCFIGLLAMLTGKRWRPYYGALIPLTFALWANLHGSFVIGLGVLGLAVAGRAIDVWRRTGRFTAFFRDRVTRRLFLMTELSAAAALINPYGIGLYAEVLTFSRNANLQDLLEWDALQFRTIQGQVAAGVALALVVVYRLSPRRVYAGEVLWLVAFGAAAMWSARMLIWWTPLAAGCFTWHAAAAWSRFRKRTTSAIPSPRAGKWSFVSAGLVWIFFAYTPFGLRLLHSKPADVRRTVSDQTPVAAVNYLREHPPKGQVFNTYEWGDWLLWAGPADVKVFLTSQAHLVPREVWRDYIGVINLASGWEENLDRYGVNTVLVDKRFRSALIGKLKDDEKWQRPYEDSVAVIFTRKKPM